MENNKPIIFQRINSFLIFALVIFQISNLSLNAQQKEKKSKKHEIKKYSEFITDDTGIDDGLFTTYKQWNNYYFEVPKQYLDREILIVSRIAGTVNGFNFGGAGMKARNQQVWRWQKISNKIFLRSVSHSSVASQEKPIYESVRNNNFEPVIMTFEIEAYNKDSTGYIIKVNDLFETDVPMISPLSASQRKNFAVRNLDKKRSIIEWIKSFPQNTEVRHILTYNATKPPDNQATNTLSLEMNQSMILLPEKPMKQRLYDNRVGYFSISQIDYGRDAQKAERRRYITRWRLEPKDTAAFLRGELVEPIKPIVYYIDSATPYKWREYIKQGIEDWQPAFEQAGFKNAIIAKDPPNKDEDPEWDPLDIRYSVIRYTANEIQNAMGPHVNDPRSGEIIQADIIWYHNVMNLLRNWFFIQTAAVNPESRTVKFKDELMGKLIRFVAAHEVGHTLGLPHNMGASHAYPVDSLRSATFTKKMHVAPAIMDYARFNYVAQPGDNAYLFPGIGAYDKWAIEWGYKPIIGSKTADDEKETLHKWIKQKAGNELYWYGPQQFDPIDPRAQTEDLGDDAMKASSYGIKNLERIVDSLLIWTAEPGKNYDDLQELYSQVIGQWSRYNGHVKSNIGGVYQTFKTYDQEGDVYDFVPKEIQKRAMDWINENTFATPKWLLKNEIYSKFKASGMISDIGKAQTRTLNQLLSANRLMCLIEFEAREGKRAYSLVEMMDDLQNGIWSELKGGKQIDTYSRNLQRAYLERIKYLMEDKKSAPANSGRFGTSVNSSVTDIRAVVRAELQALKKKISRVIGKSPNSITKFHLEDVLARIDEILYPKKK